MYTSAKSMPKSPRRSAKSPGTIAVARSSVSAGSPHHVGRNGRRSMRSAGLIAYQLVSFAFFMNFSTAEAPPTSRRKSRKIGIGSSQWPSPSMTG